jgi:SNF2 family DNA or RNA helicase
VTVYKLVVEGTVDEGIYEIGKRKTELINSVLSNDKPADKKAGAAEDKVFITLLVVLVCEL